MGVRVGGPLRGRFAEVIRAGKGGKKRIGTKRERGGPDPVRRGGPGLGEECDRKQPKREQQGRWVGREK